MFAYGIRNRKSVEAQIQFVRFDPKTSRRFYRKRKPYRLPWKRGPVAWKIACDAQRIHERLQSEPKSFLSLRRASRILGTSTQPLRDWVRLRLLIRAGPRNQFRKSDLTKFVERLEAESSPFDPAEYLHRLHWKRGRPLDPFEKLRSSRFIWPRKIPFLTPNELATRIDCHPSLIRKAFRDALPKRGPRQRFKIPRRLWTNTFYFTLIHLEEHPDPPPGVLLKSGVVARYLRNCGIRDANSAYVHRLIRDGLIEAQKGKSNERPLVVARSLKKFFRKLHENA